MDQNGLKLITIPKISDLRGNLSFIEQCNLVPFEIKRTYWIYDVPGGQERGGHAFKEACELIVPLSGSFSVEVFRGEESSVYELKKPNEGLYIPRMSWRKIFDFSTNSLCLCISSTKYSGEDYIYEFPEYIKKFYRK